ncbi:GerAB/ArcD/ProY family transporter [Paenibacillus apiarius]|uniref:GerAB/ArcD/ProY family transporter n=1 Tax=Paenibacillus apiarius TaxID=46240 RepID=UPI00197D33C1|nr:endospore germination permease [Paenibacillus apiarius]MBN3524143.1 endospore germination permease [Paenibacillus apiarius]
MLDKGKISTRELTIIVALYMVGSSILIIPSYLAAYAGQDAWISALLSIATGLAVLPLYIALGNKYPGKTLVQYMEDILGTWLGKAVSLFFLAAFPFTMAAFSLRNIGDFMTTQIMPDTPIQAIHIIFLIIVIIGVRLGLEPIMRAAEIIFPWFILLFGCFIIFISPQIKWENILPVLEGGIRPVIGAGIPFTAFPFMETAVFLMLFPHANRPDKVGRALFWGILIGGAVLLIITMMSVLVMGPDTTARLIYPSYMLARKISIGNFLERIEGLMAIIWFFTIFFKLTLLFYISVIGFAQSLNLKEYRFLTMPLGIILIVYSILISPNTSFWFEVYPTWALHAITLGLLLPALLLAVAAIRGKGAAKAAEAATASEGQNQPDT